MKRINLLDEQTWNKIAAGEVIERPFSVVKELVENSIDAKAKNIIIQTEEGGQKSIKVLDDGVGVHPEDIERAFLPHATSKIKYTEDMFKINTLGFRGEALASIASVSKTIMKSKTENYDYGKEICIEGGIKTYIKDIGFNKGTYIEVNNLFFNVPARQKFLKSSQRESALISDIIARLSLVNPNISFKLENNGRKIINTYGNGNIQDVIRVIYGKEVVDNIWYFEEHSDIASVYGYIGNADISRKSRNKQSIFVNKRYIKSSLITAAVENAFKSFLTVNKFPFFILFLDVYPEFIDVNVHPTKSEIKFSNDREIFKLVFNAVHTTIAKNLKDNFFINDEMSNLKNSDSVEFKPQEKKEIIQVSMPMDLKTTTSLHDISTIIEKSNTLDNERSSNINNKSHTNLYSNNSNLVKEKVDTYKLPIIKKQEEIKFPDLKIIGQFNNTYILTEYNKELYIIDQHAAHEKILFVKYLEEISKGDVIVQGLIAPLIIELMDEDFAYYKENQEVFKKLGFVIDEFGLNSIYIREVPIILGESNIKELFFDILNNLKNMGSGQIREIKYNKIASLACKAAVKANDKLSLMEMEKLINDLRSINEPFNCPHGRPTIIKITLNELEKRFKRIQ